MLRFVTVTLVVLSGLTFFPTATTAQDCESIPYPHEEVKGWLTPAQSADVRRANQARIRCFAQRRARDVQRNEQTSFPAPAPSARDAQINAAFGALETALLNALAAPASRAPTMTPAEYAAVQRRLAEAARAEDRRRSGAVGNRFDDIRARLQKQLPPKTEFARLRGRPHNPIGTTYQRYPTPESIPGWEKYSPEAKAEMRGLWDKLDALSEREGRVQQEPEDLQQQRENLQQMQQQRENLQQMQQQRENLQQMQQQRENLQQMQQQPAREYGRAPDLDPSRQADVEEEEPAGNFIGWEAALEATVAVAEKAASEAEEAARGNERWEYRSSACGSARTRALIAMNRWSTRYDHFLPVGAKKMTKYRELYARLRAAVDGAIEACNTISIP